MDSDWLILSQNAHGVARQNQKRVTPQFFEKFNAKKKNKVGGFPLEPVSPERVAEVRDSPTFFKILRIEFTSS
jgi:hypothetical protein